jgi:hypothetical protein
MDHRTNPADPLRFHRLHEQALAEAAALRREAIADFWRGADGLLASAATQLQRSGERLAQRLARHARQRATGGI